MAYLDQFLAHAMASRASDVHFSAGEPIRMRIDGDLMAMEGAPLTSEQLEQIFDEILSPEEKEKLIKNKNLDKSHAVQGAGNFRVNIFFTKRGFASVIRSIPSKIPTMQELGLPQVIQALCELPKGLVLVTGPTGSGKSTTLAAMINHINATCPYHILTAEDPVEFVHSSKQSLVNQREIGHTCHSFADALKYALREDPDVILVGEMRDLETIGLALTAAETGHLVFGTLHTRGAGASVDRIIDSFPANQQAMVRAMLSESLAAVISQALLKKKDGKGRVAAYEIMVVNAAISNLIREGKAFQIPSVIQTSRKDGMQLMSQHVRELITAGHVTEQEGASYLEGEGGAKNKSPMAKGPPTTTKVMQGPPPSASSTPKPFVPKELTGIHEVKKTAAQTPAAKPATPPPAAAAAPRPPAAPPRPPAAPGAGGPPKPPPMKPGVPARAGFAPLKVEEEGGAPVSRSKPQPPPPPVVPPRAVEPPPPAEPGLIEDLTAVSSPIESHGGEGLSVELTELGGGGSMEISLDDDALTELSEVSNAHIPLKKTGT